jgi:hypothetical protein
MTIQNGFFARLGRKNPNQLIESGAVPSNNTILPQQPTLQNQPNTTTLAREIQTASSNPYSLQPTQTILQQHISEPSSLSVYTQPQGFEYKNNNRDLLRKFNLMLEVQYYIQVERKLELRKVSEKPHIDQYHFFKFDFQVQFAYECDPEIAIDEMIKAIRKVKPGVKSIKAVHRFGSVYTFHVKSLLDLQLSKLKTSLPLNDEKVILEYNLNHTPLFIQEDGAPTKIKRTIGLVTDYITSKLREAKNQGKKGCITELIGNLQIDFLIPFTSDKQGLCSKIETLEELILVENYAPVPSGYTICFHEIADVERGQRLSFTILKAKN